MEIKFVADQMNGDLARWMRILGYDCQYFGGSGRNLDEEILRIASEDGRVVLTADKELFRCCVKLGLKAVYTPPAEIEIKLSEVIRALKLKDRSETSPRCTVCNGLLRRTSPPELKGRVNEEISRRYRTFWLCERCGKVYWEGSHWRGIRSTIRRAFVLARKA